MEFRSVVEKFEILDGGVRFNVETVGENKKIMHGSGVDVKGFLKNFYGKENHQIEAQSPIKATSGSKKGLYSAAWFAFAEHYPLIIRPDDIWMLITFAFSKHVDLNSEKFRSKFVSHQGKTKILVRHNGLVKGQTPYEEWERAIFPKFAEEIASKTIGDVASTLTTPFSTSTKVDQSVYNIALMSAMKKYFNYCCRTCCGIPWIELRGTVDDWKNIQSRTEKLWEIFPSNYRENVLEVLNEFVNAFEGRVNYQFWQCMTKMIKHGKGSGSYSTVSGWITLLYPYLTGDKLSPTYKWQNLAQYEGPEPSSFPDIVFSTPVKWEYHDEVYNLHYHGGVFGVDQDRETLALSCVTGWVISHDG